MVRHKPNRTLTLILLLLATLVIIVAILFLGRWTRFISEE